MPEVSDVRGLTAGDFEQWVADAFQLRSPTTEVALRLVEVRRRGEAKREGGAFSLLFVSPPGPFLPQAIYLLSHSGLGTLEVFIVPIGPVDGGNGYEAVFT